MRENKKNTNEIQKIETEEQFGDVLTSLLLGIENLHNFQIFLNELRGLGLGGALSYTTKATPESRGILLLHTFENFYFEEEVISFTKADVEEDEEDNEEYLKDDSTFFLPLTEIADVYSYTDERYNEESYICLKIILHNGEIDIAWCC